MKYSFSAKKAGAPQQKTTRWEHGRIPPPGVSHKMATRPSVSLVRSGTRMFEVVRLRTHVASFLGHAQLRMPPALVHQLGLTRPDEYVGQAQGIVGALPTRHTDDAQEQEQEQEHLNHAAGVIRGAWLLRLSLRRQKEAAADGLEGRDVSHCDTNTEHAYV